MVLLLETTETGKQPQWNLIPFVNGDRLIKAEWENGTQIATRPTSLNRMQANELYRSYKEAIYWIEFAMQHDKAPGQKFDDRDFQLTFFKGIVDKPVVDKFGKVVGHIEDVAISAFKGTIVYMVLRTIDDRRIAIPLGAFVGNDKDSRWMVEIAKDQIIKFKAFEESAPPTKADSGWLEFVAVKYGRGGLQSKKNEIDRHRPVVISCEQSKRLYDIGRVGVLASLYQRRMQKDESAGVARYIQLSMQDIAVNSVLDQVLKLPDVFAKCNPCLAKASIYNSDSHGRAILNGIRGAQISKKCWQASSLKQVIAPVTFALKLTLRLIACSNFVIFKVN